MADDKRVPTGRFRRLANAAKLGTRAGANMLLKRDGTGVAEEAADVLGSMRGLAAKVGQVASYVDGMIPETQRRAYAAALSSLQSAAPSSSEEEIRALVESELGAPVEKLFAAFEPAPFASASIGQVHRGELHDGSKVAVKVQHPGIDVAVDDDLKNIGVFERVMSKVGPRDLNSRQIYEEVAQRLREELDYTLEARSQTLFRDTIHAEDPHIVVPKVVESHSSRRVLTMELWDGMGLDQAAQLDEARRTHYAQVLWRFAYKAILMHGTFNADPHPGNYLFREDGRVVFLDFGCVQPLSERTLRYSRACHDAARDGREADFAEHAAQLVKAQGGMYEMIFVQHLRACLRPLFDSPFRVDHDFVVGLFDGIRNLKGAAFASGAGFAALPQDTILLNRLHFGFFSVLARLDVSVDYAQVERDFLPQE